MDAQQISLVRTSFDRVTRLTPHVAVTFYSELFAIDPSLRALFKSDVLAQGQALMSMLAFVVASLDRPEALLPVVRDLALRHLTYGVEQRHYRTVGTALLRTLRHELGREYLPETHQAWAAAYALLSGAMIEAAYPSETRALA